MGKLATFDLIAAVGDVDAVTAVIDPEAIATVSQVQQMIADHNTDPNAHGGSLGGGGDVAEVEITIPAAGWASSADLTDALSVVGGLIIGAAWRDCAGGRHSRAAPSSAAGKVVCVLISSPIVETRSRDGPPTGQFGRAQQKVFA